MFALSKLKQSRNLICAIQKNLSVLANTKVKPEHENIEHAKPFEEIPEQAILSREILPFGELYGKPIDQWHLFYYRKHGNILRFPSFMGRPPMVVVYDPEDMQKIYRFDGQWPHRMGLDTWIAWRERRPDLFKNFIGLVLQQGETWQKYRTIINPILMHPKTVSLYVPEIDAVARDFLEVTKKSLDSNNETPADYGLYLQRYTIEAIGTIALETRLNVLEAKEGNKGTKLAQLLEQMFDLTFQLDGMPSIWKLYKTPKFYKLMKVMDESSEIIQDYVNAALEKFEKEGSQKPEELQGVLYKLLKVDKEVALIMGMDMLSVGIDTTSSAIKSLLYLLAANPDKQAKLREEIMTVLPSKSDKLTAENMKHMPYLRACMKEAQRVLPTVVGNVRRLAQDLVLQGHRVPKGIDVFLPHGIVSLLDEQFGKAQEFIPERWLKDESHAEAVGCPHSKKTHPFSYMPFGFGTRACIGKRFADLETSILTTRLVREFEITWNYEPPKTVVNIVKTISGDYKLKMNAI